MNEALRQTVKCSEGIDVDASHFPHMYTHTAVILDYPSE